MRALDLRDAYPALDFEGVSTVALMERPGLPELASYDTEFDGIPKVQRVEP